MAGAHTWLNQIEGRRVPLVSRVTDTMSCKVNWEAGSPNAISADNGEKSTILRRDFLLWVQVSMHTGSLAAEHTSWLLRSIYMLNHAPVHPANFFEDHLHCDST